jgi:ribonuclease HI
MFSTPDVPPGGSVIRFGSKTQFAAFGFCDGSVKKRVGAFGFRLLDTDGAVVGEGWDRVPELTADSNCAEFQGLLATLAEARRLGVKSLWVGTDSFQLIEHATKQSVRYDRYLAALLHSVAHFDYVEVQAIERKRNKEADALARKGIIDVH